MLDEYGGPSFGLGEAAETLTLLNLPALLLLLLLLLCALGLVKMASTSAAIGGGCLKGLAPSAMAGR